MFLPFIQQRSDWRRSSGWRRAVPFKRSASLTVVAALLDACSSPAGAFCSAPSPEPLIKLGQFLFLGVGEAVSCSLCPPALETLVFERSISPHLALVCLSGEVKSVIWHQFDSHPNHNCNTGRSDLKARLKPGILQSAC